MYVSVNKVVVIELLIVFMAILLSNNCMAQENRNTIIKPVDSVSLNGKDSLFTGVIVEYFSDSLKRFSVHYKFGIRTFSEVTYYSEKWIKLEEGIIDAKFKRQGKWFSNFDGENNPRKFTFYNDGVDDKRLYFMDKLGNIINADIPIQDYRNLFKFLIDSEILGTNNWYTLVESYNRPDYRHYYNKIEYKPYYQIKPYNKTSQYLPDSTLEFMYAQFMNVNAPKLSEYVSHSRVMLAPYWKISKFIDRSYGSSNTILKEEFGGEYSSVCQPLFSEDNSIILISVVSTRSIVCSESCTYIIEQNKGKYKVVETIDCHFFGFIP